MITLDLSILNQKGTPMFNSDTLANRPAAGIVGRIFIAIDAPFGIYRDTGSAWDQISGASTFSGSLATGQVAFGSAANTISGTNNLFWDAANARLGIGTNAPSYNFEVRNGAVRTFITSDSIFGISAIGSASAHSFYFYSNGGDAARFGLTQNFIIGGSTPADTGKRLQVYGDAYIKGTGTTSATSALLIQNSAGGRTLEVLNNGRLIVDDTAGTQTLQINGTAQSQGIAIGTANTFATANGSGAVAIGRAASAAGGQSVALGLSATSAGEFGVAIGYLSVASSQRGIAIGFQASTSGWTNSIAFNGQATATGQFVAGGAGTITDVFFGSGPRTFNTNGTSYTINGSGGATSIGNSNGGNITIAGGKGVGNGTAGDVILSTATTTILNGPLQTLTDRWWIKGTTGVLSNTQNPYAPSTFAVDINGGVLIKNSTGTTAQITLINADPSIGGNNSFLVASVGGTSGGSYVDFQGYYGASIVGSTALRLNPAAGAVIVNSTTNTGEQFQLTGSIRVNGQTSATSGGVSGQHLIINCDGVQYKIELRNP